VGFVVDRGAVGQVFVRLLVYSPVCRFIQSFKTDLTRPQKMSLQLNVTLKDKFNIGKFMFAALP